jgi:hypothetical protein
MMMQYEAMFLKSDRQVYLAVFRVFCALCVLCKVTTLLPSIRKLVAVDGLYEFPSDDKITLGFIPHSAIWDNLTLFYCGLAAAAVLMMFGIGGRWVSFLVCIGTKVHSDFNWLLCDGGDNLLQFSLLYLSFADTYSHLVLFKRRSAARVYTLSNLFTNIAVMLMIGHVGLAYFISGISKAHAGVWYNGTALYYILEGERFCGTPWNSLVARSAAFNVIGCYSTIVFEIAFCFAIFAKRLRVPFLVFGLAMHAGIFVFMMIHLFQFIFVMHYGLVFTDDEVIRVCSIARSRTKKVIERMASMISRGHSTVGHDGPCASTACSVEYALRKGCDATCSGG